VKKDPRNDIPLAYIERNPLLVLVSVLIAAGLVFLTFQTLFNKEAVDVKSMSFFLFVPTLVISFQALWYLLNPFAIIFEDKIEIKKSILHNRFWYFVDIKKVGELKNGTFAIAYNDDEVEKLNLFGIKPAHKALLRQEMVKHTDISLKKRA
jgi:hypothetical protein